MREKIMGLDRALEIREKARRENKTVVFTNGCFDIIHAGHVDYLEYARSQGDLLIVGLNSDDSVKRIKGDKKPLVKEGDRAAVLAGLSAVDAVVVFGEDDPYEIIKSLVPDVLVKGADWAEDEIIGADVVKDNGGRVVRVDLTEGRSTTSVIDTVIERYCEK